MGCAIEVEELSVTGNRCQRGAIYAIEEIHAPRRVVTATVKTAKNTARLPVKTATPCSKEKIPELLRDIYKTTVTLPVRAGDIVIKNWNNEEIDVIATRSLQ
jgi:CxxC motif-containing protein